MPPLLAWAAVGAVPGQGQEGGGHLDPALRLQLADVPLKQLPPWLGIDRALVGWQAWRQSQGAPVLVADAGTALSLTRVAADGSFAGGRLQAGARLQWRSLAAETADLPLLGAPELAPLGWLDPKRSWPWPTELALGSGVLWGLAAAISTAAMQARTEDQAVQLWLTGGDGAALEPLVRSLLMEPLASSMGLAPNLALTALAALRPGPGR